MSVRRNGVVEEWPYLAPVLPVGKIDCLYFCGRKHTPGKAAFIK